MDEAKHDDKSLKSDSDEPGAVTPPRPGEVIAAGTPEPTPESGPQSEETAPAAGTPSHPAVVTGGGKRSWLSWLLFLAVIAALAAGGWYYYQQRQQKAKSTSASQQNKDIPLLKIGMLTADFGTTYLYPDMPPNDYAFTANGQIFEGLVRYEDKSKIVPDLASDWSNPDSKTWTFTIKSGIKFHDGNTLTANDVKYSIDKVIASKSDLADTFAGTIASVDVTAPNKVKITTTDPDPTLLNKLTFLYVIDANLPKGDEPSLAGTGPYKVKPGTKPTNKNIQMVAFDGYHGGRPTTRALVFEGQDKASGLTKGFNAHQYNIIGYVLPSDAQSIKGAHRFITSASDVDFFGFNTVAPGPLQNKLVREAIRYAVNVRALGEARSSGVITPLSQMIPPSIPGYNPAIPAYKQDIAKAKQLLTQAGYPNGLTLRYSASSDTPALITEVVKQFKAAGITVNVDQHPDFNEFIDYFTSGKAEMFSVDYSSDTLDGLDIYTTTLSTANYNNPKVTAIFDQAVTTVDPAKRLKLLQDAAVIIDQDIPTVPISTEDDLWLMDKNYVLQQDRPSSTFPVYLYKVHLK